MRVWLPLGLLLLVMTACDPGTRPTGDDLAVRWSVIDNVTGGMERFDAELTLINRSAQPLPDSGWAVYFNFPRPIFGETVTPTLRIDHVNGDLFRITAGPDFDPQQDTVTVDMQAAFWVINRSEAPAGFYLAYDDGTADAIDDVTIGDFSTPAQTQRFPADVKPVADAAYRYQHNAALPSVPPSAVPAIVPTPQRASFDPSTTFGITLETIIYHDEGLAQEAAYLAEQLGARLGIGVLEVREGYPQVMEGIRLYFGSSETNPHPESYQVTVVEKGVRLFAPEPAGVFYGIQSLLAMLPIESWTAPATRLPLPIGQITDAPRFDYRGMHLDVGRHFHGPSTVKKLIDGMAFYKLNRLHFHLTDDEGWRLEIPGLPELTTVGARRGHTLDESDRLVPSFGSGPDPGVNAGSGFYSRAAFVDLLRYATARHIEVIPEIDMPGHARAAIVAMEARHKRLSEAGDTEGAEQYRLTTPGDASEYRSVQGWTDNVVDVCRPSTYAFLEKVTDEIMAMYAEAEAPLTMIHTGGDEVPAGAWSGSPACKGEADVHERFHDFFERFAEMLFERDLRAAGWEEVALLESDAGKAPNPEMADQPVVPYVWNTIWGWGGEANAYRLANAGYDVVLSNATNLYFDLAYAKHPDEPGYYWADFVDTRKAFGFIPLDLYRTATQDRLGQPIAPDAYDSAERLTATGRDNILGIQGQLWSENAKTEALLEYLIWPKLLGLAERAWAVDPDWAQIDDMDTREQATEAAWVQFAQTVGARELPRLDVLGGGMAYRIPPPGAILEDGVLYANMPYPSFIIRYTTDGSEPTANSPVYTRPVTVDGAVRLKAFNAQGRASRTVTLPSS
ncbi:MAG: family 20 glycosylhydrolase [Rhodothermales bacterium]